MKRFGTLQLKIGEVRNLGVALDRKTRPYLVIDFDKNETVVESTVNEAAKTADWKHKAALYASGLLNGASRNPSDVNRESDISLTLWQRQEQAHNDKFLGQVRVRPNFSESSKLDEWFPLTDSTGAEKLPGELHLIIEFGKSDVKQYRSDSSEMP